MGNNQRCWIFLLTFLVFKSNVLASPTSDVSLTDRLVTSVNLTESTTESISINRDDKNTTSKDFAPLETTKSFVVSTELTERTSETTASTSTTEGTTLSKLSTAKKSSTSTAATIVLNEVNHSSPLETSIGQNKLDILSTDSVQRSSGKPENCDGRRRLDKQPTRLDSSVLKKCCPIGESIYYNADTKSEYCDTSDRVFEPSILDVTLYDNCIEDNEVPVQLDIEATNPCNVSFVYSQNNGDLVYVVQDGSLLIMDEFGNESYSIEKEYCLETDHQTGDLFAIVCVAPVVSHIGRGQTILFGVFMLVSIPCLIAVSFIHFAIRRLRTMHGVCLAFLSCCLAIGFLLHTTAQLFESTAKLGYAVQYFMLSYFLWLSMMCFNVVMIVWYYLPHYIRVTRPARIVHFIMYLTVSFVIPLCIVLLTRSKGLPGMPSYFYQAWSESIQSSQRYFIPPVTTILIICFIFLIIAYFGFRKLDKVVESRKYIRYQQLNKYGMDDTGLPIIDEEMLEETKQDAKCITFLLIIILTTWVMEIITFYSPGTEDYLAFMEIINGLQGAFILMIFIGLRHRREIIVRWWHDRGSFGVAEVEMQNLSGNHK